MTEEIHEKAKEVVESIAEELKVLTVTVLVVLTPPNIFTLKRLPSQPSITFDAWTSKPMDPYLGVTAHFISNPPDAPTQWSLEHRVLGVTSIDGRHTGANMAATLMRIIDRYAIRDKVRRIHTSQAVLYT
jgi:hypothetical protein